MRRLARKYWDDLPWSTGSFGPRDAEFRTLEASDILAETTKGLEPIDDLAIVVLFLVFESQVRDYLVDQIQPQAGTLTNPILQDAAEDAIQGIKEGSFYRRVLEPLKKQAQARVSPELVTAIDQVRQYRNWVAHGRRDAPTNYVTPRVAYERLTEFLSVLGIAPQAEQTEAEGPNERSEWEKGTA
jgi:hypothetical protein